MAPIKNPLNSTTSLDSLDRNL